eukprot:PhF_6_TR10962/c0_g1_i1/m.17678
MYSRTKTVADSDNPRSWERLMALPVCDHIDDLQLPRFEPATWNSSGPLVQEHCRYLSIENAVGCLHGRKWLFLGNSHLRGIVKAMLLSLGIATEDLEEMKHSSHSYHVPQDNTLIVFIWTAYGFEGAMNQLKANPQYTDFDGVIVNNGAWDMMYNDTHRVDYIARVKKDLAALSRLYSKALFHVFLNMNQIYPVDPAYPNPEKAKLISTCFQSQRLEMYRSWNEYAVCHSGSLFRIWDTFSLTSTPFAESHVWGDGHHYSTAVSKRMIEVLSTYICRHKRGVGHHPTTACPIPLEATSQHYQEACASRRHNASNTLSVLNIIEHNHSYYQHRKKGLKEKMKEKDEEEKKMIKKKKMRSRMGTERK